LIFDHTKFNQTNKQTTKQPIIMQPKFSTTRALISKKKVTKSLVSFYNVMFSVIHLKWAGFISVKADIMYLNLEQKLKND